jgi:cytochrome c-type biogenesis protein CcmE
MNSRARNRLIAVTVVIFGVAAVLLFFVLKGAGSSAVDFKKIAVGGDASLVGTRVNVSGAVVAGSWDKKDNPMVFTIRAEGTTSGPEVQVIYEGSAPSTFGGDTVAILTGTIEKLGVLRATEMTTKCPSKYETSSEIDTIAQVLAEQSGTPIRATGFIKPGSLSDATPDQRFVLTSNADGTGPSFSVKFSGAMPAGTKDGAKAALFGKLEGGVFVATDVTITQN